jgi:hypothetical protein
VTQNAIRSSTRLEMTGEAKHPLQKLGPSAPFQVMSHETSSPSQSVGRLRTTRQNAVEGWTSPGNANVNRAVEVIGRDSLQ